MRSDCWLPTAENLRGLMAASCSVLTTSAVELGQSSRPKTKESPCRNDPETDSVPYIWSFFRRRQWYEISPGLVLLTARERMICMVYLVPVVSLHICCPQSVVQPEPPACRLGLVEQYDHRLHSRPPLARSKDSRNTPNVT